MVDVTFVEPFRWSDVGAIGDAIGAVKADGLDDRTVRYTVADAGRVLAELPTHAGKRSMALEQAEQYTPDFDEVFVRLVERHRNDAS